MPVSKDWDLCTGELSFFIDLASVEDDKIGLQGEHPLHVGIQQSTYPRQGGCFGRLIEATYCYHLRPSADGIEHFSDSWHDGNDPLRHSRLRS